MISIELSLLSCFVLSREVSRRLMTSFVTFLLQNKGCWRCQRSKLLL